MKKETMRVLFLFTLLWKFESRASGFQHHTLQASRHSAKKATTNNENSRLFMSIPNGLDTLTSGLASIVRFGDNGLAGVTVSDLAIEENRNIRLKLYDVENSRSCRVVRELVTELDLVVDKIIPVAIDSQNELPEGAQAPCLVASMEGDEDEIICGAPEISQFLKGQFSVSDNDTNNDSSKPLKGIIQTLSSVGLFLASALRTGRGSSVSPSVTTSSVCNRPKESLILYSYEGNQFCRLVREVLTELDIVYELRSAGKGSSRRSELSKRTGGSTQCPYLGMEMNESVDIIRYLYSTYALWTPPNETLEWSSQFISVFKPLFAYLTPLQAGSNNDAEQGPSYASDLEEAIQTIEQETSSSPVVVYTYELSPFSSETKSLLASLKVDFKEISLGKEWIPGLLSPGGAIKRAALLELTGQSSLPHIFIGGKPIGGLFSGAPGIVPLLQQGKFMDMIEAVTSETAESIFE